MGLTGAPYRSEQKQAEAELANKGRRRRRRWKHMTKQAFRAGGLKVTHRMLKLTLDVRRRRTPTATERLDPVM